jgi:hypothetical protein
MSPDLNLGAVKGRLIARQEDAARSDSWSMVQEPLKRHTREPSSRSSLIGARLSARRSARSFTYGSFSSGSFPRGPLVSAFSIYGSFSSGLFTGGSFSSGFFTCGFTGCSITTGSFVTRKSPSGAQRAAVDGRLGRQAIDVLSISMFG